MMKVGGEETRVRELEFLFLTDSAQRDLVGGTVCTEHNLTLYRQTTGSTYTTMGEAPGVQFAVGFTLTFARTAN